ncbi:MAG TPA: phosphatidylglycerophosphatase A [Holophagaceae bacterium]|jgi:phosphatidylglycerophosphatase A|nr:phosphatidylglycerophosphatase A [Holophagaceae bacterium]
MSDQTAFKAPRWAWWVATGFGSGRLKPAPGTWGSLAALFAWCGFVALTVQPLVSLGLSHPDAAWSESLQWAGEVIFLLLPILMTWIAVKASDLVVAGTGLKDPGFIVADEWAGLWIALWALRWPLSRDLDFLFGHFTAGGWRALPELLLPFLLFRLFDIWKPWPVRQIQILPGGAGVVADDVVAGLYAIPASLLLMPLVSQLMR